MADDTTGAENGATPAAENGAQAGPQVGILAQYVKDLSFENPRAPQSLQVQSGAERQAPNINVDVNINVKKMNEDMYEIELRIEAGAKQGDDIQFAIDLLYGGVFGLKNVPEEMLEPFLLIEAPRLLFPFARRIISDCTRDGGFPPLQLDPIDFAALYIQQKGAIPGMEMDA